MSVHRPGSPASETELLARARALEGETIAEIARSLGAPGTDVGPSEQPRSLRTRKGAAGALIERALGARPARGAALDFPHLGIELKTVPLGPDGDPRESTFVCQCPLADADRQTWEISWARKKLSCVLWVPVLSRHPDEDPRDRRVGAAVLWRPTPEHDAGLRADFEEIVGLIAMGHIEALTGHVGQWLQARPKAAHSRVRTWTLGPDLAPESALPRGFYLRRTFTAEILRAGAAARAG